MAIEDLAAALQQYDPPIYPKDWDQGGKKFYNRLIEVLDDIYRRYGRLNFSDLAPDVREWKVTTDTGLINANDLINNLDDDLILLRQDVDGNTSMISQQAEQITMLVQDVAGNTSSITQQAEQIALIVQDVEGNASAILQHADQIQQIVQDVEGNTSSITQQADQILSMVQDIAGNTSVIAQQGDQIVQMVQDIAGNTSTIAQQGDQIVQMVQDIAGNTSAIVQNADSISSLVTATNGMQTQITQQADLIASKASAASVDALTGRVTVAETTITQQAGQIALKANATTVDALTGRVTTAEASILQMAGQIALKASQTQVDALAGTAASTGALLAILKTMIGAQVYEATYQGGVVGQGTSFPASPTENMGFIRTDYVPPRFYVRQSGVWVEKSAQTLKTSGITIQPGQVDISTPNLNINLTKPGDASTALVSLTPSGMIFKNTDGQKVFEFDTATGSLLISGIIYASGGMIGGFEVGSSVLRNSDTILLDSAGQIRIGPGSAPYFQVNNNQTYIGNAVVIKPGTLPVTNMRPNLYYDNTSGILYRTTWAGSAAALAGNLSLTGNNGAQANTNSQITLSWHITGGTPPYQLAYTAYKAGSSISYMGTTSVNATGSLTFGAGSTIGTIYATGTVYDADGAMIHLTSNSITVQGSSGGHITSAQLNGYKSGGHFYGTVVPVGGSAPYQLAIGLHLVGQDEWVQYGSPVQGLTFTVYNIPYGAVVIARVYDADMYNVYTNPRMTE